MKRWLTGRGDAFREEKKRAKKRKRGPKATLSFAVDDEEGEEGEPSNGKNGDDTRDSSSTPVPNGDEGGEAPLVTKKKAKLGKNPNVDTSFLPDREREEEERRVREELRKEWLVRQEELKNEDVEITYSYWDGSGHRKAVSVCVSSA